MEKEFSNRTWFSVVLMFFEFFLRRVIVGVSQQISVNVYGFGLGTKTENVGRTVIEASGERSSQYVSAILYLISIPYN